MGGPEGPREREALSKKERAALESMREPMLAIMEELGPLLEAKEISGVVAVDASGRPVGRLVSEIARRIQGKGIPTHFLPSLGSSLKEVVQRMRLPKGGAVLLVDDTYAYGTSLDPIAKELQAQGYTVRVVALYDAERNVVVRYRDALVGIHDDESDIHAMPTLSGVRNEGSQEYAHVLRSSKGISPRRFAQKIAQSRQTINKMADEIVAQYQAEK